MSSHFWRRLARRPSEGSPSPQDHDQHRQALMESAAQALAAHDLDNAKRLYLEVVSDADDAEALKSREDGVLCLRVLTSDDFVHYVKWMTSHGRDESLKWIPSLRAQALYRLGYICVEQRAPREAIAHLERARAVLPQSAKLTIELALCHGLLGDHRAALDLYRSVGEVGYYVTPDDKAASLRGAGAQLIELGDLDGAAAAFTEYIGHVDSKLARNELAYIEHVRKGGAPTPGTPMTTRIDPT